MAIPYHPVVKSSPLLSRLSPETRNCLMSKAVARAYHRGTTLFMEGERATRLLVVVSGWVKLYRVTPSGSEAVIDVMTVGQSFEENTVLCAGTHRVSAETVSDASVLQLDLGAIAQCRTARTEMAEAILMATAQRVDTLLAHVEELKTQSAKQRVTTFLLSHCEGQDGACAFDLPYDKYLIAGRLGMKPESLSRAFGDLKQHGVDVRQNRVTVAEVGVLAEIADQTKSAHWAKPVSHDLAPQNLPA